MFTHICERGLVQPTTNQTFFICFFPHHQLRYQVVYAAQCFTDTWLGLVFGSCFFAILSNEQLRIYPMGSMYSIYTYIWLIFMVNVGKYTIDGYYGYRIEYNYLRYTTCCWYFSGMTYSPVLLGFRFHKP